MSMENDNEHNQHIVGGRADCYVFERTKQKYFLRRNRSGNRVISILVGQKSSTRIILVRLLSFYPCNN